MCENCQRLPTAAECQCCLEFPQIVAKNKEAVEVGECEQPPSCITEHPGFQAVCLNRWVLQAAWYQYKQNITNPMMVQITNLADILHTANLYAGAGELLARKLGCRCPHVQFVVFGHTFPLQGWRRSFS